MDKGVILSESNDLSSRKIWIFVGKNAREGTRPRFIRREECQRNVGGGSGRSDPKMLDFSVRQISDLWVQNNMKKVYALSDGGSVFPFLVNNDFTQGIAIGASPSLSLSLSLVLRAKYVPNSDEIG